MINAVIVGAGYAGRMYYAKALPQIGVNVMGIVNRSEARGKALAEELGAKYYASARELPEGIDAAFIATSTDCHVEHVREILAKGIKRIFCEKPMGINTEETIAIRDMCEEAGAELSVGYKMRFENVFAEALKRIENGEIGTPVEMVVSFYQGKPPCDWYLNAGCIREMSCHTLDLANTVAKSEPKRVLCTTANRMGGEAEDAATYIVEYRNGMRTVISSGWISDAYPTLAARRNISFFIAGTGGYITGVRPSRLLISNAEGEKVIPIEQNDPIPLETSNFLGLTDENRCATATDAIKVQQILAAVFASIETGASVDIK